ncbi:DUF4157 domain-containing protein [Nocardioides sp. C4-1]|uniref:eCIS core domain-containing protein n=1 Tax=Nocardioides sp. C4-1 TaxID=3151851 RepID=UPI0032674BB1
MARSFATPETDDIEKVEAVPVRRTAAPLVVGAADDRAEIDADRVADEVINRLQSGESSDLAQAQGGESHVHNGCHGIARQAAPSTGAPEVGFEGGAISDDLTTRIEGKRGSGSALPGDVRRRMEAGFGTSLADVRVHTDGESADLNRSISARAFTTGSDIFFGSGEFSPGTAAGERVLAHEIAHTRQQGGGARRIHRKWDMKAKNLNLHQADSVSVFSSRPIIVLSHPDDGDKLVVKGEDQPVGLGELTAKMQKKAAKTSSVKQRTLTKGEQGDVSFLLGKDLDDSWDKRGQELAQQGVDVGDDPKNAARMDVLNALLSTKNKPVAMTYAEGEGADKLADPANYADRKGDDDKTEYRKLVMDPQHLRALGRITAIDAFMGNMDRVVNANAGNWFVDLTSKSIQLIDSVDPGQANVRVPMKESFADGLWEKGRTGGDVDDSRMVAGSLFFMTDRGDYIAGAIAQSMANAGVSMQGNFSTGGDVKASQWMDRPLDSGETRREFMAKHLEVGFTKGKAEILKIFAAPKWHDFKLNKKRKSIKKSAASAEAADGVGADSYYRELSRRAALIKSSGA